MRFDTINKKPKLWNIAILTAVTAAVVLIVALTVPSPVFWLIMIISDVYLAAVLGMMINAWIRQIRYNPYSYNSVYYIGFALFILFDLILMITMTISVFYDPEKYTFVTCLEVIMHSARNFMMITSPLIFFFAGLLVVSNVDLMKHEGRSIVNSLGIVLAFVLVAGELFIFFSDYTFLALFTDLIAAVYLYFECMMLGTIVSNAIVVTHKPDPDKDFIIILGCAIRPDGTPRPLLQSRIDKAMEFAKYQVSKTGKEPVFVASGGQGADEAMPESTAIKRYLLVQGIPEDRIIEEDKSTNTLENMRYSKEKISAIDPSAKVIFSTTNYHVFRSGTYARKVKMRATGIAARTKWYFWPNASVREFVSLLTEHRRKQVLVLGGLLMIYVVLTLVQLWAINH